MKRHLLIIVVFFLNILVFAQNKGIKVDLQVGEEDLFIEFIDDKTYTFYSPLGNLSVLFRKRCPYIKKQRNKSF